MPKNNRTCSPRWICVEEIRTCSGYCSRNSSQRSNCRRRRGEIQIFKMTAAFLCFHWVIVKRSRKDVCEIPEALVFLVIELLRWPTLSKIEDELLVVLVPGQKFFLVIMFLKNLKRSVTKKILKPLVKFCRQELPKRMGHWNSRRYQKDPWR